MAKRKKILIVEDEASLNKTLSEFLESEGFEVASAMDGEQGLELATTISPDLILLDIIIPKKDGYEVLEELKKDDRTKNIPTILLTNLEGAEDIQKAFDKGATTYLVKSAYKMGDVARKIKDILKIE